MTRADWRISGMCRRRPRAIVANHAVFDLGCPPRRWRRSDQLSLGLGPSSSSSFIAASVRLAAPSFARAFARWRATVCWLRLRRSAMCRFVSPVPASCRTSTSRSLRPVRLRRCDTRRARLPRSSLRRASRASNSSARVVPRVPSASTAASRAGSGAAVSSTCRTETSSRMFGRPAAEASSTIA